MNAQQQKLLDDARLLRRFLSIHNSGSTLSLNIKRFTENPDANNERALRSDIKEELDFLKSLTPTYRLHSDWITFYSEKRV